MGHKKKRYMGICDVRHDILIFFSINCSSRCFPKRKQPLWKACPTQLLQDELVQNFLRQARAAVKWACSVMMSTRLEGRILMGSRSWLGSEWCHSSDISTRPCETPSPLPFLCPAVSGYTDADGFVFLTEQWVSGWVRGTSKRRPELAVPRGLTPPNGTVSPAQIPSGQTAEALTPFHGWEEFDWPTSWSC